MEDELVGGGAELGIGRIWNFPPTFLDFKSKVVMNLLCDGCDPRAKFAIMWRLFLQVLQRFSFLYEDFSRRSL